MQETLNKAPPNSVIELLPGTYKESISITKNITLIGFAKYIEDDEKKKLNLKLRNSNDFIQINPVRKKNNTSKILNKTHKVFFGSDTKLNPMDKLIYLANNHINFDKVIKFINNKNGERK